MTRLRYAAHPGDFKRYDTDQIREAFLIEDLFANDELSTTYSHYDRLVIGGVKPVSKPLRLETFTELKANYFLERRELGIINVGAPSSVSVDGKSYDLNFKDALYVGSGAKDVVFQKSSRGEALFYFNSAPAHTSYPTRRVALSEAESSELGSVETSNHRTIKKLIVNSVLPTCQLQMGLTELKPGSIWNTMPPHTHNRRMEAYFYFEITGANRVCHFLGEPGETRHLWVGNNQAALSPPWSIHCGAGTSNYSFIWGMAGENLDYSDMDQVTTSALK